MIKNVNQLIERIEDSKYVKERLREKHEVIASKYSDNLEKLRRLLNFICPNLRLIVDKPFIHDYKGMDRKYFEDFQKYYYQNSHENFDYSEESYEKLVEYIKGLKWYYFGW